MCNNIPIENFFISKTSFCFINLQILREALVSVPEIQQNSKAISSGDEPPSRGGSGAPSPIVARENPPSDVQLSQIVQGNEKPSVPVEPGGDTTINPDDSLAPVNNTNFATSTARSFWLTAAHEKSQSKQTQSQVVEETPYAPQTEQSSGCTIINDSTEPPVSNKMYTTSILA